MTWLFVVRFAVYLITVCAPLVHPGLRVFADVPGLWGFFGVIPAGFLIGYLRPALPGAASRGLVRIARAGVREAVSDALWIAAVLAVSFVLAGLSTEFFRHALMVLAAYAATRLIFEHRCFRLIYAEPVAAAALSVRLLHFSRSSLQMAEDSGPAHSLIIVVSALAFAAFAVAIYRAEFRIEARRGAKTAAAFVLIGGLFGALIAALAPPQTEAWYQLPPFLDAVVNPPARVVGEGSQAGDEAGNLAGDGGASNRLLESPSAGRRPGAQGGGNEQHLAMIVSSPISQLYLAQYYYADLDPIAGFELESGSELNELPRSRYVESWINPEPDDGKFRDPVRITAYSVFPDRVAPYWPSVLEPAVKDDQYYPVSYTYRVLSRVSPLGADRLPFAVQELTAAQIDEFARYLEVPLEGETRRRLDEYVDSIVPAGASYTERISFLLGSYDTVRYRIGYTDDVSIEAIERFLFEIREGDCTEFSNATALLARIAGIPSRVVTGYILAEGLQTSAHRRGIDELRAQIPALAAEDAWNLYMITDMHHHSWTQMYIPGYGWVDIETTSQAIPPDPSDDINTMDVVIPIISARDTAVSAFPWRLVLSLFAFTAAGAAVLVYLHRWAMLIRLIRRSRSETIDGIRALYRLFLIRLTHRGFEAKRPDLTAREYAKRYPELSGFAEAYTKAVYTPAGRTDPAADHRGLEEISRAILDAHDEPAARVREIFWPIDGGLL